MKSALSYLFTTRLKEKVSSHDFRHSKITDLSQSMGVKEIQSYVGHTDAKTTLKYVHTDQNDVLRKVAKLSRQDEQRKSTVENEEEKSDAKTVARRKL